MIQEWWYESTRVWQMFMSCPKIFISFWLWARFLVFGHCVYLLIKTFTPFATFYVDCSYILDIMCEARNRYVRDFIKPTACTSQSDTPEGDSISTWLCWSFFYDVYSSMTLRLWWFHKLICIIKTCLPDAEPRDLSSIWPGRCSF